MGFALNNFALLGDEVVDLSIGIDEIVEVVTELLGRLFCLHVDLAA